MKRFNYLGRLSALVVLFAVGSLVAMAESDKYYSKAIVNVASTGGGKVYVTKTKSNVPNSSDYQETDESQTENGSSTNNTYYLYALAKPGYEFVSWSDGVADKNQAQTTAIINANKKNGTVEKTFTATFKALEASVLKPLDLTNQIVNPSADNALAEGWTATNYQKADDNTFQFIHWTGNHMSGEISQTINDIPNGFYKVSVKYVGVWNDFTLSANNDKSTVGAGNTEWKNLDVFTDVTNGQITIKLENKCTGTASEWCGVDDFTLTYYGPTDDDVKLTIKADKYGTFVAPIDVTLPENVLAYQVSNANGTWATLSQLTLTNQVLPAGTPVIVKHSEGTEVNQTYKCPKATGTVTGGNLTGFYVSGENVPTNAYVLQDQDQGQKFYQVVDEAITGVKNRCYLNAGVGQTKILNLAFDDEEETAIEEAIEEEVTPVAYFSTNGTKLSAPQKGINLVKMSNGSVKKIYVK